jgi:hypothetical protein
MVRRWVMVMLAIGVSACRTAGPGELIVTVTDAVRHQPLAVSFTVEHLPGDPFFALVAATSDEKDLNGVGLGARRLALPPGRYAVRVERFPCGAKVYFTSSAPAEIVTIRSGRTQHVLLNFDSHSVATDTSFDNPNGVRCEE